MRRSSLGNRRSFFVCIIAAFGVMVAHAQFAGSAGPVSATEIAKDQIIQPDQLNRELQAHAPALIFQVGSKVLFDEAHIPGAEYAGPGSRPEGLEALRDHVAKLPRSKAIVLYCGCCPWDRCPNVGLAWRLLREMGFTQVKVMYIADNFGANWVSKGYRADKSQ